MSNEVKIPVSLPGAAQASADAAKVAAGLQGIGNAAKQGAAGTKEQGDASKEAGENILSLGETTEKGIGIGRLFSEVLQGNFYALGNVTAALKVTGAAMKTSVVGITLLALTALAQFLPTLIDKLRGPKDSLEEGFEAARKAAEKLNQAKMDSLQANISAIKDRASAAVAEVDALQAASDKLDDAGMAAELAENKVMPGRTDEEKATYERSIRGKYAQKKRAAAEADRLKKEAIAQAEVEQLAEASTAAGGELAEMRARTGQAKERRASLAEEIRSLEIEQKNLGLDPGDTPEQRAASGRRSIVVSDRLRALSREKQSLNDPAVLEQEKRDLTTNLPAKEAAFAKMQADLLTGLRRQQLLRSTNQINRDTDARLNAPGGPLARLDYANRYGAVMDTRTESDPVYRPDTLVRDSRSLREGRTIDTKAIVEGARKNGREMAEDMAEVMKANNEAIRAEFRRTLAALPRGGN